VASQPLDELTTTDLVKRKRFAKVVLWVMVVLAALNLVAGVVADRPSLLAITAALFAVGYPMYAGRKKVEAELARRREA
jgi:hypothetical protein